MLSVVWVNEFTEFIAACGLAFRHGFALEINAVGGLDEPIEDGVCEDGVEHAFVPEFDPAPGTQADLRSVAPLDAG